MIEAWWQGYDAGLSSQDNCTNPYPIGMARLMWEAGHTVGCQVLATILEDMMNKGLG